MAHNNIVFQNSWCILIIQWLLFTNARYLNFMHASYLYKIKIPRKFNLGYFVTNENFLIYDMYLNAKEVAIQMYSEWFSCNLTYVFCN